MEKNDFFSYSWHIDEEETNRTVIRIYGLSPKNENVCVIVNNFLPYAYLELPDTVLWDDSKAGLVASRLNSMLGENKPVTYKLEYKKRLYYANLDKKLAKRVYPYIQCCCSHTEDIRQLGFKIRRPINIPGIGAVNLKLHEHNASPILQLTSKRKLPTAGWISFLGKKIPKADQVTHCDYEYVVKWENLEEKKSNTVARPLMMGYDIEVNSSIPSSMPKAHRPEDKVFQISCVFTRQGNSADTYEKYILTLGEPDPDMLEDIEIRMFDTESELLVGFTDLIQEKQPNVIIGYNIFTFDIPYMIDRAKLQYCIYDFDRQTMKKYAHAKERTIEWSSSAYKNQSFQFLDAEGRIFIDLLPLVKRDYKMNNYKLKTIASHFLKDMTKDPLDAKGIFKCYRLGMKGGEKGSKALSIVAKYCVKDSELVVRLCETLTTWIALCEMSKVTNVPIFQLYTQGQQLKVFSNAYKKCTHENIVVEKDAYIAGENDHYIGATVFPPVPGVYEKVVPFDFCLAGETLVSLDNGCSRPLEELSDERVVGWSGKSFGDYKINWGLQDDKGERETVKIWLQDGTYIVATPEHKFMLDDGSWCRADELKNKYVKCGIATSIDLKCREEKEWTLSVSNKIFSMKTEKDREDSLAFSRMLGYILTDGSIYISKCRKCAEVYTGTLIDAEKFHQDISRFHPVKLSIRKRSGQKGTTYCINIPQKLADMIHSIEGIVVGKRATQKMRLPAFLLDEKCPLSIVREFLAGLFGGDGTAPFLSKKTSSFSPPNFKWTTVEKYKEDMLEVFQALQKLLAKFNVISTIIKQVKIKYTNSAMKPKDADENPRWDTQLNIATESITELQDKIGFRYCINKSCKLTIASSYHKMQEKTRQQHSRVLNTTISLLSEMNTKEALEKAREEVFKDEPVINEYSLSSVSDIHYQKHEAIRHSDKPRRLSLQKKKFPTTLEYITETNTTDWFTIAKQKRYAISGDSDCIPSFRKKVIDIRPNGIVPVFDIEVDTVHNFLANGVCVSNCSLYPSTIIAYNISWDTLVLDDSIPDSICHVMEWEDHSSCVHDPKEIRKAELNKIIKEKETVIKEIRKERDLKKNKDRKEEFKERIDALTKETKPFRDERSQLQKSKAKYIICCKRKYRWLKSPMGVLPEILTHLLETRSATKKEMKAVEAKLKEMKENTQEYDELSTYHDVLDQRQLALKVSSNSVTGDTPIPCKINGIFCYRTIEELSLGDWVIDKDGNELATPIKNVEVWSDLGFTKIKYIFRHVATSEIKRIITPTGIVDCTEDHSLLRPNGEEVKPSELSIGEELMHYEVPLPSDTPIKPLFSSISNETIETYKLSSQEEEESFIWGLFFAEGTAGYWGKVGKYKSSWIIYNKDLKLLERAKSLLERVEKRSFVIKDYRKSCGVYHLKPTISIVDLVTKYRSLFYSPRKLKKIPDKILNSSFLVRQAFFMGYYAGDGNRNLKVGVRISNKGHIGSASLYYLARSLGYEVTVNNYRNDNIYNLQCSLRMKTKKTTHIKTIKDAILSDYPNVPKIEEVRNKENIVFTSGISSYRNIEILCERFPRQKLLDSLDYVINICKKRNAYIIKYETKTKLITYRKYCCDKETKIRLNSLTRDLEENVKCMCENTNSMHNKNEVNTYIETPKKFYVYDIETESHHFAAGIGNMIVHNSGYGCLGVKRGYLPLMPGAMATTYMGRKAIEKAAESIQKDWGGVLVYGDSVSADTPILVKYPNGSLNIQTIDTIGNEWVDYDQYKSNDKDRNGKEQSFANLEVWTNGKWSKIRKVIRHKTVKKMYRILTHTGCVDVTEDHSLLRENGEKVKPAEVKVGESLLHSFPSTFEEFDTEMVEGVFQTKKCKKCNQIVPEYEFYTQDYNICKKCCYYTNHRNKNLENIRPYTSDYEYKNMKSELTKEEAFIWGFFMADGSGGKYASEKYSWAINNQNLEYLNRAKSYLEQVEPTYQFKILDTMKSSHVYKLVPTGKVRLIAEKYHQIMYDKNKYKIVPYPILNSSEEIKEWFFEGYYTGDGYKPEKDKIIPSNGSIRLDCKGKIGTQGLYLLLKSIGYKNISINTRESKPDIFRINASKKQSIRKSAIAIKKIIPLEATTYTDYVYDLETEEGIFHAGIGELVVKNTDSNYVNFPQLKSAQECWDYSVKVAKEVSSLFPKPMSLAFEEKVYWRFFILTKKRYMSLGCKRDGVLDTKISKKGVLLQRRDNCQFIRKIYGDVVMMIFEKKERDDIISYILEELNKLCGAFYPVSDFVVTKSVGEVGELEPTEGRDKNDKPCYKIGDYKVKLLPTDEKKREEQFKLKNCSSEKDYYLRSLPAQVQLAEKMRERGQLVSAGSRLEYVITTTGGHNAKQYIKVEDTAYFSKHSGSLSIDYLYYLKQLSNPLDQVLDIIFSEQEKGFMLKQYKYRLGVREKVLAEIRQLFKPKIIFDK